MAGPEQFRFDEMIRMGLSARKDPREVIVDPHARYFGTELSERSLVPSDGALLGETRFEDWLIGSASQIPPAQGCGGGEPRGAARVLRLSGTRANSRRFTMSEEELQLLITLHDPAEANRVM